LPLLSGGNDQRLQSPPNSDQLELTIFGAGVGESILIHLGGQNWIVIDSLLCGGNENPSALEYLHLLNLEPSVVLRLIVATHWHDDHIRGLRRILASAPNSPVVASAALGQEEFIASVSQYESRHRLSAGSGVRELYEIHRSLGSRPVRRAFQNRPVLFLAAAESGHGYDCTVTTLSPSDAQFQKFLEELTALMPELQQLRRRAIRQSPNYVSIVLWIECGRARMLLGADLEEVGDPELGWTAIVGSRERPPGAGHLYKISHHGSKTGHHPGIWSTLLHPDPIAVLAPYNRGRSKLPTRTDVTRILEHTGRAYAANKVGSRRAKRRAPEVDRTIRVVARNLREIRTELGIVRVRSNSLLSGGDLTWSVECFGAACHLSQTHNP
jgi:beta-lactamase superfamily II metal-dependent hydrolase